MSAQQSDYIPIREWFLQTFGKIPAKGTISCYVKTKQIYPEPVMFTGKLMCKRDAKWVGMPKQNEKSYSNPLVERIMNHGSPSKKVSAER